jgi:hypothetical protein
MDAREQLLGFVLDKAIAEPVEKRIRLYRAAAEYIGNKDEAATLLDLAENLEITEKQSLAFNFEFRSRQSRK